MRRAAFATMTWMPTQQWSGCRASTAFIAHVPWPPSAKEPSRTEAKESLVECEGAGESRLGGKLEIMAATDFPEVTCSFSAGGGERSELLGRIYPSKTNKLYCIDCPEFSSSASSISLQVEAPSSASLELNLGVGLRLRGHDLLTSLKVEAAEEVTENMEDMEAFQRSLSLQAAHHGTLHALPLEINVYANGLTITCASDLRLGHGAQSRRLFRFVLSPVTCELRSAPRPAPVELERGLHAADAHHAEDKMYGFRICGHEALPGVQYVDANSYILNPYDWSSDSPEQHALVGGHWTWDGFYYLLAYKRSKRRLETYLDLYRENTLDSDTLPLNQSTFWQMPSNEAAERFVGFVDFVFVDGSHAYEDVFLDLRVWWPKVRPGGVMAGHDYNAPNPGVVAAVNEFTDLMNLSLHLGSDYMWWLHEIISKEKLRALHAKFDKNHDGKVSLAEVLEFASHMSKAIAGRDVEAILEEIDTNKDGKLSLKEHLDDLHRHADKEDEEEMKELELRKAMEAAKFKAADSDHDEETNSAVLRVVVGETMKNKDTDGDGRLSFKEFAEAEEDPEEVTLFTLSAPVPHPHLGRMARNVEGTKPMEEDEKLQLEEEMKDFKKLDKNGDGLLDMDELAIWESGLFHTEAAMIHLLQIADKDGTAPSERRATFSGLRMALTQQYNQQLLQLNQQYHQQKAALEQQAMQLTMEYQQQRMQEEMAKKQAELQKEHTEVQARFHQDLQKLHGPGVPQDPTGMGPNSVYAAPMAPQGGGSWVPPPMPNARRGLRRRLQGTCLAAMVSPVTTVEPSDDVVPHEDMDELDDQMATAPLGKPLPWLQKFLPQAVEASDGLLLRFMEALEERGVELYPAQEELRQHFQSNFMKISCTRKADHEAIVEIFSGAHVVLDTPTGSGKSLVAVAALFKALGEGAKGGHRGRAYYTSPTKALTSEKFFDLCRHFGAKNDRSGRPVRVVSSTVRPVPLQFSYSEDSVQSSIGQLVQTQRAPIYVVHFSQREALETAKKMADAQTSDGTPVLASALQDPAALRERVEAAHFSSPFGVELRELLLRGVGVHHAGLLPCYRRLLQQQISSASSSGARPPSPRWRRPPRRNYQHWTQKTFTQLQRSAPDPLRSQFRLSMAQVLSVLQSAAEQGSKGEEELEDLIAAAQCSRGARHFWRRQVKVYMEALRRYIDFESLDQVADPAERSATIPLDDGTLFISEVVPSLSAKLSEEDLPLVVLAAAEAICDASETFLRALPQASRGEDHKPRRSLVVSQKKPIGP
eukprot:g26492.t2